MASRSKRKTSDKPVESEAQQWCWPVSGPEREIARDYSPAEPSVELTAGGRAAVAVADGVVVVAGPTAHGHRVWIQHPDRSESGYIDLRSKNVQAGEVMSNPLQVGDKVRQGQIVGLTGPTLRFSVRDRTDSGQCISRDPASRLPQVVGG